MAKIKGHVTSRWARNSDGTRTCYLRWRTVDDDGTEHSHHKRLLRTEPWPTKARMREWKHTAARACMLHECAVTGSTWLGPTSVNAMPLKRAIEDYLDILLHQAGGTWTPNCRARERVLERFVLSMRARAIRWGQDPEANFSTKDIRQGHAAEWRDIRAGEVKPSTLKTEASYLQTFLDWLGEQDMLSVPVRVMTKDQRQKYRSEAHRRFLEDHELAKLLRGQADDQRRRILTILAGTGMRIGELRAWGRVWWAPDEWVIHVPEMGRETRKRHARNIPVGPYLAEIIGQGGPFTYNDRPLKSQPGHWCRPFGCSPHDLRRWFASTLMDMEAPEKIREALLGHTSSGRDAAYYRTPKHTRRWAEKVDKRLKELCGG